MPRFVLLRHEFPSPRQGANHWDFMLETDGRLTTWKLAELPSAWAASLDGADASIRHDESATTAAVDDVPASRIADHRIAYLDYEGPISNDRGAVTRCDRGEYVKSDWTDELCRVILHGAEIQGGAKLRRIAGDQWRLLANL